MLRFCEGPKPSLIQSNQATPSFCVTSGRRGGHDFWRTETQVVRGINAFAEGVADNPTAIFVIKVNLKFCSQKEMYFDKKKAKKAKKTMAKTMLDYHLFMTLIV